VTGPRIRHIPTLDVLEGRQLPSASVPANTLEIVQGSVNTAGTVTQVSVPIAASTINGRIPIIIGAASSPVESSGVIPEIVSARGPDGRRLPVQQGFPYVPGVHDEATAFVQVSRPGTLTLGVSGTRGTTGAFQVRVYLPGDLNGDHQVTFADLQEFPKFFGAKIGDPRYNVAADANLNGQIGQEDGRALVRNLNPGVPRILLKVKLTLDPKQAVKGHVPSNSGGHTYFKNPTILGKTTPGSIVFADNSKGDYEFKGAAIATDAKGNFSYQATNKDGINNNDFLVIDPFGQQKVQDYPIYYFPAVYSRDHPTHGPVESGSASTKGAGHR
jgi:hypothetical protein